MEIKDIVTLIEAVSEHNLTSLVIEENGTKLSLKREKERETVVVPAPAGAGFAGAPMAGAAGFGTGFGAGFAGAAAPGNAEAQAAAGNEGAKASDALPEADIPSGNVVTSPLVGTFYAAPSPDAENFVKVGDTVKKGQVLGIIEAMKLMNEIESDFDGVVEAVLVNNEEVVEYGQPLFRIR